MYIIVNNFIGESVLIWNNSSCRNCCISMGHFLFMIYFLDLMRLEQEKWPKVCFIQREILQWKKSSVLNQLCGIENNSSSTDVKTIQKVSWGMVIEFIVFYCLARYFQRMNSQRNMMLKFMYRMRMFCTVQFTNLHPRSGIKTSWFYG